LPCNLPGVWNKRQPAIAGNDVFSKTRKISFAQLRPSMIVAEPVLATNGMKLLGAESTITEGYIELLARYALSDRLKQPITIYRQQG